MIQALIFDFDGLIIDTETPEYRSWQEVFARHGCELPLARWAECIGLAWGSFDPYDYLEELAGRPLDREGICAARSRRNAALLDAEPIMPGVLDYLDTARRLGLRVGIASSSPRHWVMGHLDRFGLTQRFEHIICAEDAPHAKPDPALYRAVLQALNIAAGDAIALEDSPNGITAAKRAGLWCTAVPNPITCHLPLDHADLRLDSLAAMPLDELLALQSCRIAGVPPAREEERQ